MNDRDLAPEGEAGTTGEATAELTERAEPTEASAPAPGSDRRAFLRQLSGDAVTTAGRFAGLSSALRRSVFVAGQTAINGLESIAADPKPPEPASTDGPVFSDAATTASPVSAPTTEKEPPTAPGTEPPPMTERPPAANATSPVALDVDQPSAPPAAAPLVAAPEPPDPVPSLSADQQRFLTDALHAIVAVTDPGGPPHLTSSAYHWDGLIFRLPGQMFTARASHLDRDPRVSLLIGQPGAGESVMVSGVASSIFGDEVEADMLSILGRGLPPEAAAEAWVKLRVSGDRMTVRIRPTRFVWRRA